MKAAVLLSGCGVYDGSEIHEAVSSLICLKKNNINYNCFSVDIMQKDVIDHQSGNSLESKRNVMIESSRISRGKIFNLKDLKINDYDFLLVPGGFGVAKNLSTWAYDDINCTINNSVKTIINNFNKSKKPIISLCISTVIIAMVLAKKVKNLTLTIGSENEASDYDILKIQSQLSTLNVKVKSCTKSEVCVDKQNRIISAPCYMMIASVDEVYDNINQAILKLKEMLQKNPHI